MKFIRTLLAGAACLLAASAAIASAGSEPDLILTNGKIVTVDAGFSIAQAVAIRGQRITAVGDSETLTALAGPDTRIIDLSGRTVIPGLIDNHSHIIRATEYWASEVRLDGVASRKNTLALLAARAATLANGKWIFSLGGWYEDQFTDSNDSFTLAELDGVAPGNPLFMQAMYDHALVNSAWLRAMGIPVVAPAAETSGAAGLAGDVVRDANGRATGRLNGGFPMIIRAMQRFPAVDEAEQFEGIAAMLGYLNSLGLTTVFDPGGSGINPASYQRFATLADAGKLSLRVYYTLWGGLVINTPEKAREFIEVIRSTRPFQGDVWFNQIAMGEVYYPAFHWDQMTRKVNPGSADIAMGHEILLAAAAAGWPVQTHAIHPANLDRLLTVMEEINKTHPLRPLRWSVTHADNIGAAQIERARALGMNLQLRSQRVIGGQKEITAAYGEAGYHMPPLRLVQDSGIDFGLGTDGTKAAQINPFVTLWWAVTGKMLNGNVTSKEVLTREEALIAMTRSNALLTFQEENLGSIAPGMLADLVVLDRDYLTVPVDQIKDIRPLATMVGGRLVFGEF
ncbi:MAG: amidohydrolase [Proteobacteria bacterium]|nr:amidohydrolase [Pseudomonadota bacterium]